MRATARGVATLESREWLEKCPAVGVIGLATDHLVFQFDPKQQPKDEEIPDGVFFDLAAAPF